MEIDELELGIQVSVRRRLKVFDVNLVSASEKEDLRRLSFGWFDIFGSP